MTKTELLLGGKSRSIDVISIAFPKEVSHCNDVVLSGASIAQISDDRIAGYLSIEGVRLVLGETTNSNFELIGVYTVNLEFESSAGHLIQ